MAITNRSIDRKYISLLKFLAAILTLIVMIGITNTCSAQTKKVTTTQTKTTAVKEDHNTPMPDNTSMVIPADKQSTATNTTETSEGSYMDRAISNYVYQQKAKKAVIDSAATKNTSAITGKNVPPADKEKP